MEKNTIIKNSLLHPIERNVQLRGWVNRVHKKAQYLYGCFCMKGF